LKTFSQIKQIKPPTDRNNPTDKNNGASQNDVASVGLFLSVGKFWGNNDPQTVSFSS
jgi:hypothetical protein